MFRDLLVQLARALDKRSLPYMLIGGQAILLYGEPRLTKDIDITLGVDHHHLPKLLDVAQTLSLKPIPDDVEAFVHKTMVLPLLHLESGIRVDFIFSFTPYEKQAIERAKRVEIDGTPVSYAAIEDIIIHKVFAGRPRDLEDIKTMLIKQKKISHSYIVRWLQEFDKSFPEKNFLQSYRNLRNRTTE